MDSLTADFTNAGLPLELRDVPITQDATEIVQMDIADGAVKNRAVRASLVTNLQRFRVYAGNAGNTVEVVDADRALHQLVLRVDEPQQSFEIQLSRRVVVKRETEGTIRHFLLGMDESHLFIALLPSLAQSVRVAHEILRPAEVGVAAIRQGEWFFVPLDAAEEARVDRLARRTYRVQHRKGIAEAASIRRLGRPHIADEIVVVTDPKLGDQVYVRGAVVHPDHRTLVLRAWHLTIPNTEAIDAPIPGVDWYD